MNRPSRCRLRVLIVVAASSVLASPTRAGATRVPACATTMPGGSVHSHATESEDGQGSRGEADASRLSEAGPSTRSAAHDAKPRATLTRAPFDLAQRAPYVAPIVLAAAQGEPATAQGEPPLAQGERPAPQGERPVPQGERPAAQGISLVEALAAADLAPEVVLARAEEKVAQEGVAAAAAPAGSSISAATHSVTAHASIALSTPIRWGGQRSAAVSAARAGADAAGSARAAAQAAARREIRTAWFSLAAAEAGAKIADDRASRARRNADAVAALLGAGRATRLDDSRARAEAALASAEGESAEQLRAAAAASLGLLLGRPAGEVLATAGEAPRPAPGGSLEEVRARALARSAEARAAEARVGAAEARLALARKQRLPALALEAGADIHDPTQEGTDSFAGFTVTLAQGGAARERVAQAEREVAALDLERIRRTASTEAESAWRRARAAALRFETLESTALPAAREAAELARLAWSEGRADLFRLLEAERALAEAEQARWDAWLAWGIARADLSWFTGADE